MSVTNTHNNSVPAVAPSQALPAPEILQPEMEPDKKLLHTIQAKLTVGSPDDPLEDEADAMADRVMRMPDTTFIQRKFNGLETIQRQAGDEEEVQMKTSETFLQKKCAACDEEEKVQREMNEEEDAAISESFLQRKCAACDEEEKVQRTEDDELQRKTEKAATGETFLQKKCASCEEEEKVQRQTNEEEEVQRKSFIQKKADGSGVTSDAVTSSIHATRGSGSAMDSGTKTFMESRFGADFSGVNIHTSSNATGMSRELNAKAFTVGNDIYFNEGQYNPSSDSGKHLLAHELTHTIQQGASETVQQKPATVSPRIQRATPDDDKLLTRTKEDKVIDKNIGHWERYELAAIMPLRNLTPETTPYAYSNRTYRAQKLIRDAKMVVNEKFIGVDGIFGPEMLIFLHMVATDEARATLRHQVAGLGFDMETLASDKANIAVHKSYTNLFKPRFLHEWDTTGPGDVVFEHITVRDEEASKKWCDSILFSGGAPPQNLVNDGFSLGQRYAILKKVYAGITFKGRAALVTVNREFLDISSDNAAMVDRDPGKTAPNPLRVGFMAQSNGKATEMEGWFGLQYPDTKAKGVRRSVGLATINGIPQLTGVLASYYIPPLTAIERARIEVIRDQYIQDWMNNMEEYIAVKQAAIIGILNDENTSWYIIPGKLNNELGSFWNKPIVFEKLLDKLATHPDKNYFDLMVKRVRGWKHLDTLETFVQLCNKTKYKDNAQVKEAFDQLTKMKHSVQAHDYVTGTEAEQGVWINKERGEKNFLKIGDVTTGMYRITETKERLKEEKRAKLEAKMRELVEARIANGLSDNPVAQKEMNEKELMESVLEQAAKEVGITESDIEEVQFEEAFRVKGVTSKTTAGVEEFFVKYERVARLGGEGNKWEVTEASDGFETRKDFETALGWFHFHNTMKATEKLVTYMAIGELVIVGGIVLLSGGGAALLALGGGAKMVGISIGISVLIYVLTAEHLTIEGFLKAALEGYLMAVGLRFLSPLGTSAAKLIGTATFRQKLVGLVVQSMIVGGGSGALTSVGGMLIEDIIRGKLRSPGDYLKGAAFGFLVGTLFELGGSIIIGKVFRGVGKNVLEKITNIEQLKAFFSKEGLVLSPAKWRTEITKAYAGFTAWAKENLEGKVLTELLRDAKEKAKAVAAGFMDAVDLAAHRQSLDLIEAGMTSESVGALDLLITSTRKKLGRTASRELLDDMLNQLVKDPARANPFFSVVNAADNVLIDSLMQGKKLSELANSPSALSIATNRSPAEVASLLKNHFEVNVPETEAWAAKLLKQAEETQTKIMDLLKQRGSSVTPKSLLRIAESGTALSDEVVEGVTRMVTEARPKSIPSESIEKMLADMADDKVKPFLESMGSIPKSEFDDLLALAAKPDQAARLVNYVKDNAQLTRMLGLARKNADALDNIFQLTSSKGNFADDIEALLTRRGSTTESVERLVTQFHGDAGLARRAFDNLSPHVNAKTLDKMFQTISTAGAEGQKLAQVLGSNKFGNVDGYIDLVKKSSTDLQSIKAVNQSLDKAEALSNRGITNDKIRIEDDRGTGFHDVDVGIKNPATPGTYLEAYQFKTLDGALTANKIQGAAKQFRDVVSTEKILEFRCDPSTTRATIESDAIMGEMRYQAGLKVPGKGNGITEFHFILSDGTVIIKTKASL